MNDLSLRQESKNIEFLDLNKFKCYEDNLIIVFRVPMNVCQIDTTTNRELMNTLFDNVTVELNHTEWNMQIVSCYKKQ